MCGGVLQSKNGPDYCQENDGIIAKDNSENDESASQVALIKAEWIFWSFWIGVVHIMMLA